MALCWLIMIDAYLRPSEACLGAMALCWLIMIDAYLRRSEAKLLQPVLYAGRHSGASLDRLEGRLSLAEVMKRGRWRATSSVARYEKRALVQEVLHRMRTGDKAYCLRAEAAIGGVLRRSFARG